MTVMSTKQLAGFKETLDAHGVSLARRQLTTLQVNVGKLCNQACHHCHVEAGPKRTEIMTWDSMERILALLEAEHAIHTVDITGGAPEMNPHFRRFVRAIRKMGRDVIDRCNLTVLFEQGQEDTAAFLAAEGVQVVASLPCYSRENVEKQRGKGVFDGSIRALQLLNGLGYGMPESGLFLNLVYNPGGAFLPPPQEKLQADYQRELGELFGIRFNELFTITNMPIKRFLHDLERQGKYEAYMQLLVESFNPHAAEGVMCRDLVSIGWDGGVYDCDFNQMLEIPAGHEPVTIWDIASLADLVHRPIALDNHCYGCTAGAGSSCGGALAPS
jgi:radical SAM/Cys-rich protein